MGNELIKYKGHHHIKVIGEEITRVQKSQFSESYNFFFIPLARVWDAISQAQRLLFFLAQES